MQNEVALLLCSLILSKTSLTGFKKITFDFSILLLGHLNFQAVPKKTKKNMTLAFIVLEIN